MSSSPCRPGSHACGEPGGTQYGCRASPRGSLGAFEDLHDAPALGGRQRTGLHDQDAVTDAAVVLLVVRLQPRRLPHDLAVEGVLDAILHGHDHRLVHLVADHDALTGLARAPRGGLLTHASAPSFSSLAPGVVRMPSSR